MSAADHANARLSRALPALFVSLITAMAFGDDLTPPSWRGQPGATTQHWTFSSAPADWDHIAATYASNPFGAPSATVWCSSDCTRVWQANYADRQGVIHGAGVELTLTLDIPNYDDTAPAANGASVYIEQHAADHRTVWTAVRNARPKRPLYQGFVFRAGFGEMTAGLWCYTGQALCEPYLHGAENFLAWDHTDWITSGDTWTNIAAGSHDGETPGTDSSVFSFATATSAKAYIDVVVPAEYAGCSIDIQMYGSAQDVQPAAFSISATLDGVPIALNGRGMGRYHGGVALGSCLPWWDANGNRYGTGMAGDVLSVNGNWPCEVFRYARTGTYRITMTKTNAEGRMAVGRVRLRPAPDSIDVDLSTANADYLFCESTPGYADGFVNGDDESTSVAFAVLIDNEWHGGPAHGNTVSVYESWEYDIGAGFAALPALNDGQILRADRVRLTVVEDAVAGHSRFTSVYTIADGKMRHEFRHQLNVGKIVTTTYLAMLKHASSGYRPQYGTARTTAYDASHREFVGVGKDVFGANSANNNCTKRVVTWEHLPYPPRGEERNSYEHVHITDFDPDVDMVNGDWGAANIVKWATLSSQQYLCVVNNRWYSAGQEMSAGYDTYFELPVHTGGKEVWLQLVHADQADPISVTMTAHGPGPYAVDLLADGSTPLGNDWWHKRYVWQVTPNPVSEQIQIASLVGELSEVVVDTICTDDLDRDGVPLSLDNCPTNYNPGQEDDDGDGVGNACDNCDLNNPDQNDCQGNGIGDLCDIAYGSSSDEDGNGFPDECGTAPPCAGDCNCDGYVSTADVEPFIDALIDLEDYYMMNPACDHLRADLNGNGSVDLDDVNPLVEMIIHNTLPLECP